MRVCIDGSILGETLGLLCDLDSGSFRWVDGVPPETWVLGDKDAELSIDLLLRVLGKTMSLVPSASHERAMETIKELDKGRYRPKWRHLVSPPAFQSFVGRLLDDIRRALDDEGCAYYTDVLRRTRACLGALERACVDVGRLDQHMAQEENATNRATLATCIPDDDGFSRAPTYDQFSTITGRLTMTGGPRVLTLNKGYRDVFRSRYPGGSILLIDYRSLEPRIALSIMGKGQGIDDIYADIDREVFDGSLDRDLVKSMSISILYGAQEETIKGISGLSGSVLADAMFGIGSYLGVEQSRARLIEELKQHGFIKNFYGRRIFPKRDSPSVLYNYFIQSSAVDASLLGFSNAVSLIKQRDLRMHPLFVIVDALMLDVHPDDAKYIGDVLAACGDVPGFGMRFPVKSEEIRRVDK